MSLSSAARGVLRRASTVSLSGGSLRTQPVSTAILRSLSAFPHLALTLPNGPPNFQAKPSNHEIYLLPPIARGLRTSAFRSSDSEKQPETESEPKDPLFSPGAEPVYEGVLATTATRVKMLSVASCFVTTLGSPPLIMLSRPELSIPMQCTSIGMLAMFGFFTTALLQWFVSPYCLRIAVRDVDTIEVVRLNFLARRTLDVIDIKDIQPPKTMKPLCTFMAGKRIYFFDREVWIGSGKHQDVLKALLAQAGQAPLEEESDEEEEEEEEETPAEETDAKVPTKKVE